LKNGFNLDQRAITDQIGLATEEAFDIARAIYEDGGHSSPFASLTLAFPLTAAVPQGTLVYGTSEDGNIVMGETILSQVPGDTTLEVRYSIAAEQATFVGCQVGALPLAGEQTTRGCKRNSTVVVLVVVFSFLLSRGNIQNNVVCLSNFLF